jgi:ribosome maturation factor RimP
MLTKQLLQSWIEQYLAGTDYELVTLNLSAANEILVEVDRLAGVDVDFCAELNRVIVERIKSKVESGEWQDIDYSLEVGSVSLTDPFKTKMQYEKNLGHDVEVMVSTNGQSTKYKGQLVSMDEETFSVDCEEKVKAPLDPPMEGGGKTKRPKKQIVTHTWRYDEPKYVRYDLKF